ncbi:MAG: YkgJ family cysteine cluster protein [Planctomycetota bacterium]
MRFECTQCGNCCRNHGEYAYVYLAATDVAAMSRRLKLAPKVFLERYCVLEDGMVSLRMDRPACPFLGEDNRCGVYEVRPMQCRTWPFWEENLKRKVWKGPVKDCCPGIDQGPLTPADEVERIAAENEAWYEE